MSIDRWGLPAETRMMPSKSAATRVLATAVSVSDNVRRTGTRSNCLMTSLLLHLSG